MLSSLIQLLQSLFGHCSAILEKLLSAVKLNGRKPFMMLIVLCFAFSFPASAGQISPVNGVIIIEPESFGIVKSDLSDGPVYRFDDIPSTFEFTNDQYIFSWQDRMALVEMRSTYTNSDIEFSVIVNLGDGSSDLVVSFDSFLAQPFLSTTFSDGSTQFAYFSYFGLLELYVDGNLVYSEHLSNDEFPSLPAWKGTVSRYIEYRITTTAPSENFYNWQDPSVSYERLIVDIHDLYVNDVATIIEDISISVSKIENDIGDINQGIGDLNNKANQISTTVTNIETGVVGIESEITNMHNELSDSNSNIWQAGATTIKESVKEIFVPSEEDLQAMNDQLVLTVMEKAEPLYVAREYGSGFISSVVETFYGAGAADRHFEFPGISFPFNGQMYELIPAQEVSIDNDFVTFLHSVFALIVGVLCLFSLIHILEDAFYCIISGVSFWGFIKGRHDR